MATDKNLEPAGVQLKTEGSEAFDRVIKQVNARFDSMQKQMQKLAKESKTTNTALKKIVPDGEIDKSVQKSNERMGRLMDRMRKMQSELRQAKKDMKEFADAASSVDLTASSEGGLGGGGLSSLLGKIPGMGKISGLFGKIPGLNQLTGAIPQLGNLSPMLGQITAGFGGASAGMLGMAGAAGIAAVAVGALVKGFIALGKRGAAMEGVINSFAQITSTAGIDGFNMLNRLTDAAGRTITRFEGMRLTNMALAGASQELAKEFGNKLPQLMEVARAQARATGQDVNFLFESLVTGVKRSSPMLIDNTGLVLKVGEAKAKYAASIGVAVNQLTAEQEKIAILNATLEAGAVGVEKYGRGQATAAEMMQRMKATTTDMLDRLSVAVQPVFKLLLEVGQALLDVIVWPINNFVAPVLYELGKIFAELTRRDLKGFVSFLKTAFGPGIQNMREWINYGIIAIRALGAAGTWLRDNLYSKLGPIFQWFARQIGNFFKLFSPRRFFEGGAAAIGALAGGFIWAADNLVAPAVLQVATMVADFLCGFSPPPKGPLSQIDQGGANVIDAWMQGMGMASLQPVTEVAAAVDAELGSVGKMGFSQVEGRLKTLDLALRPYQEALDIAKAKMAALTDPLNKVKDIIQKKLDLQLKKFLGGEVDAASVRAIDRQKEALDGYLSGMEDATTESEYQLILAQARQAQERALLTVQKNRLGEQTKLTDQTAAEKAAGTETAAAGSGSGETPDLAGAGAGSYGGFEGDPLADFVGTDTAGVDAQMSGLADAFNRGFNNIAGDSLKDLRAKGNQIQQQMDRITKSKPGQILTVGWNAVFGDGPDSLQSRFDSFMSIFGVRWEESWGLNGLVSVTWTDFLTRISNSSAGAFLPPDGDAWEPMSAFTEQLIADWGMGGSVGAIFSGFSLSTIISRFCEAFGNGGSGIRAILRGFKVSLGLDFFPGGFIDQIFALFGLTGISQTFRTAFGVETSGIRVILRNFREHAIRLNWQAGGYISQIFDSFSLSNIESRFAGVFGEQGTIRFMMGSLVLFFTTFFAPNGPFALAFDAIGVTLRTAVIAPIGAIFNGMIDLICDVFNRVTGLVNNATSGFSRAADFVGIDLDFDLPTFSSGDWHIDVPQAKKGGEFGPGLLKTHKDEVIASGASRLTVFPVRWVKAMERIASGVPAATRYAPGYAGAGSQTINSGNSNNLTVNFNGVRDNRQNLRMKLAEARAIGW